MKKIKKLLLAIVMLASLVSINSYKTKAEASNNEYEFKYINDVWECGDFITASYGSVLKFTYVSGNNPAYVIDSYGFTHNLSSQTKSFSYTVYGTGTEVTKSTTTVTDDTLTINDTCVVKCDGLIFETDGYWYDGSTKITNPDDLLLTYGIIYTPGTGGAPGTAVFEKSLSTKTSANASTLHIKGDLNIKFKDYNLSLANTTAAQPCINIGNDADVTIDGSGKKLTIIKCNSTCINSSGNLKLKNMNLSCETGSSGFSAIQIAGDNNLKLEGNCDVEIIAKNSASLQFTGSGDIEFSTTALEKSKVGNNKGNSKQKTEAVAKNSNGIYCLKDATTYATYVRIINNEAIPTTTPNTSIGEMIFDKTRHDGKGAFVYTMTEGHSSTPAIAYIKNFEHTGYNDIVYAYDGTDWNPLASGYNVETSAVPEMNAEKYTKVSLTKNLLNDYLENGDYYFKLMLENADGVKLEYYIDVIVKENTNTPDKKDESCEKVIGPTWHWNNKKGICEDTGVVKTYTR